MENKKKSNYYFGIIYWDPRDKRIFVPKRFGFGWTINFANPFGVIILIAIITVITLLTKLILS